MVEKKSWNPKTKSFDIVMVPKTEEKKSRKLRSKSRDAAAESKESSETAEAEKKQDVEMEEKKVWNPKTKAFDIVMVPKTEEKKSRKLRSKSREAAAEESSVDIVQQRKQRHEEKNARSKSREAKKV